MRDLTESNGYTGTQAEMPARPPATFSFINVSSVMMCWSWIQARQMASYVTK